MEMKVCLKTLIEGKDGVTFTYTQARMHAHAHFPYLKRLIQERKFLGNLNKNILIYSSH